ncbi:hypothetical protein D3C85_1307270 [compost metagenome]
MEVFHLLQHRVRCAGDEDVARQQQHRQTVDVRGGRGGHQVVAAGADRGGHRHHAAAEVCLGIGGGGQRHALLVVGAEGGQRIAHRVQRLAEARHVAVAENGPHPAKKLLARAVFGHHILRGQIAHQRLGHRQAYCLHLCLLVHAACRGPLRRRQRAATCSRYRNAADLQIIFLIFNQ